MNVQVGDIGTHENFHRFPGEWEVMEVYPGTVDVMQVGTPHVRYIITTSRMSFTGKRETIYEDMVI